MKKKEKYPKLEVKEELRYQLLEDGNLLKGDINIIIKRLQDIPERFLKINPNFIKFEIQADYGFDDYYTYLYGVRIETDEEYAERMILVKKVEERNKKAAKTRKEAKEKTEREIYEKLKKKYEKQ